MPDLKPIIKINNLSPNLKITAYQLTPEEHADGKWHGAGIDEETFEFLETLPSWVSSSETKE